MENNEVTNYLLAYEQFKIIQRKDMFNFSLDTVLLANFCTISKNIKMIVDFGTNNAAIPMLLSMRCNGQIEGVEIQKEACDIANKNIELNQLTHQVKIINQDIKDYVKVHKQVDLVVCNPPFFKIGEKSNLNENRYLQIARHEIKINLEEIIASAAKILKVKGRFAIVHRTERMIEIIELMKKYNLEPKKIQYIYPKQNKESNIILIEAMFHGNPGVKILPPIIAHEENGNYSKEVRKMFGEIVDE